jgi:hypothetical protein
MGRDLKVNKARPREDRKPSGGGEAEAIPVVEAATRSLVGFRRWQFVGDNTVFAPAKPFVRRFAGALWLID